jgi:hypothetical protein
MGYQLVAYDSNGRTTPGVAWNGTYLMGEGEMPLLSRPAALHKAMDDAELVWQLEGLRLILPSQLPASAIALKALTRAEGSGADAARIGSTSAGETFKRFSAFRDDRRINADGSLKPGSYATTAEDAARVRTGKEAVERYALPNPDPAVFVFTIQPLRGTEIQRGVAQPKFGHKGGGVEVLFRGGTTEDTVSGPDEIPAG